VLIRSWNLFHGNTVPPQREGFLDGMLRLAAADDPDVLCLQEVPAWALGRFTAGDVAARPAIGPLPIPMELGRRLTEPNHGLLRSAFSGQGNAIHVSPRLRVLAHETLTLNPRRFRAAQSRALELGGVARLAWAKERRIVQALRVEEPGGRTFLVANLHCTSYPADERLADAELLRAAWFAVSTAAVDDVVVLAGDFNVRAARSRTLRDLASSEWGFSEPGPGIDHILVRGAPSSLPRRWPDEQRQDGEHLLSDHAPVEVDIT
jgi:endonuclease/exonuclease/phosphatase family metal-dependent hydrolase